MLYDPKWEEKVATPVLDEPWRKMCLDAAMVLEKKGWCQKTLRNLAGNVCLIGALLAGKPESDCPYASLTDPISMDAGRRIAAKIGTSSFPTWNDAPGRTKEEVINMLREVAAQP